MDSVQSATFITHVYMSFEGSWLLFEVSYMLVSERLL